MPDTGLADLLSGAVGAPVDRPKLDAFVANSQAVNGLRSAQTEDAMIKAQQGQEQMTALHALPQALMDAFPDMRASEAALAGKAALAHFGDPITALNFLAKAKLGYDSPAGQVAGQQMFEGKVAPLQAVPNNYAVPAGQTPPTVLQSPQGAAMTSQTTALTGLDVARADEAHAAAKAKLSAGTTSLSPQELDEAAYVTMADPTKMGTYAGYGARGQANKDAINNRRAELLNRSGMSTDDMIRQRAIAKASVGSAGQAAKQLQTLEAFMPLIKNNGDRINALLDQIDATGGGGVDEPLVNGFERMLGRKLNSDDLTELHSVFTAYQSEVGRLLASGPTMNGVISDHARDMLGSMAPESMSASGARRVLNRIDTEINVRHQGVAQSLHGAAGAQLPVTSTHQPGNVPAPVGAAGDIPPGFIRLN